MSEDEIERGDPSDEPGAPQRAGVLTNAIHIFTSPANVFEQIAHNQASILIPFILIAILYMVSQGLVLGGAAAVLENNPPENLTPEQVQQQIEITKKFGFAFLLLQPIGAAIMIAAISGLILLLSRIYSDLGSFRKIFTLNVYTGFVSGLGSLLSSLVVRARGFEDVMVQRDLRVVFGLPLVMPDTESDVLATVYDMVGLFEIWVWVLLILGLSTILRISKGQAVVLLVPIFLIGFAFALLGNKFG